MSRIRLTEKQLHNVIRESVSNILNELNWKTYNNAAKKRSQQIHNPFTHDEYEKSVEPLLSAMDDALERQYPHCMYDHELDNNSPEKLAYNKDLDNQMNGRYKYEKGGRGYYVDDDDE